jgi:hypothetical protein
MAEDALQDALRRIVAGLAPGTARECTSRELAEAASVRLSPAFVRTLRSMAGRPICAPGRTGMMAVRCPSQGMRFTFTLTESDG